MFNLSGKELVLLNCFSIQYAHKNRLKYLSYFTVTLFQTMNKDRGELEIREYY